MKSLLASCKKEDVRHYPYPHIIIKDPISSEVADRLAREFPPLSLFTNGNKFGDNVRMDYTISDIRKKGHVSDLWREFAEMQSSREFWLDFVRLFGDSIKKYYPELLKRFGDADKWEVGHRFLNDNKDAVVNLDTHISINTPIFNKASSVRMAHVDDPRKLYGGLYYLRSEEDDSIGADLLICKYKNAEQKKFFGQEVSENQIETVGYVPFERGAFVFFLNTIDSLHSVTPRSVNNYPRHFVNLVAEMEKPLFDIISLQENIWKRRYKTFRNKMFA